MQKWSFRARRPSKSASWRCETKLSHETSLKMKVEDMKACENVLQIPKVQSVKMKPELAVPMRGRSDHDPNIAETVSQLSAGQASPSFFRGTFCPCKTQHFVHPRSLKNAFRARLPSKSESWRYENEALVRDFPQNLKVEAVKTKLSCETFLKKWKREDVETKMWKRRFCARLPSNFESSKCENKAWARSSNKGPIRPWSEHSGDRLATVRRTSFTSFFRDMFSPAKRSISCIRYLSKTHFVRVFPPKVTAEDMKTKLWCETSLKKVEVEDAKM